MDLQTLKFMKMNYSRFATAKDNIEGISLHDCV